MRVRLSIPPLAMLMNPTVTDPKSSMLADGYNLVSSELSNGVTFELWSQTQTPTPSKRSISDLLSSTPEKRSTTIDLQGGQCNTSCAFQTNVPKVNTADCAPAYTELYNKTGVFTLPPSKCSFLFILFRLLTNVIQLKPLAPRSIPVQYGLSIIAQTTSVRPSLISFICILT